MRKHSYVTVTDQFCGAGGSSRGATDAGAEVRLAMNHWDRAIETHQTNFPDTDHDCTDISACDPRRYPRTDILITSPECTNHSIAKGKRRPTQADLFGNGPDPAEDRSRATMWDVPRFAEVHRYEAIVVENVVDARNWVNWTAWLLAMRQLGYDYQAVFFNSMHAHPTPQSRDRIYVVFWRKGNHAPDLDLRPVAHCAKCGKDVQAVQTWKQTGKRYGRYRQQYLYRCPTCASVVEPYYYCAASAIDWSLPCPRIGDRATPLKEKTLARIRVGLEKFGRQPLGVELGFAHAQNNRAFDLIGPMRTQTTRQTVGLAVPPFLVDIVHNGRYGRHQDMVWGVTGPDRTQIAQATKALIVPYYLVQPGEVPAVEDCGFRMLQPHEIQAAMAFPADYVVTGTKREKVKQLGNAVTPPVMAELLKRVMGSLT